MQFEVVRDGVQRVGKFTFDKCSLETPLYMVYTSRGCIPNLTPDNFKDAITTDHEASCLVNLNFWDL
jgi:queuine/archaeosine tRNA-ribosyltransferase